jgi:hypothetical protein
VTVDWPTPPPWGERTLAELTPALARALGVNIGGVDAGAPADRPTWELPPARAICLFLVDGLGDALLRARTGHVPTMRGLLDRPAPGTPGTLRAGFPTTTAVSLASLGTGLPPGRHGMVGTEVLDPDRGVLFSELAWSPEVDPVRWQSHPTVFQQLRAAGVDVHHVAPALFDGSGLTVAALRGPTFAPAAKLTERVEVAARLLQRAVTTPGAPPVLVLLYWEGLDKTGHVHGWQSEQWTHALEEVDAALSTLLDRSPADAVIYTTGDHGMIDIDPADRLDLTDSGRFPGFLDGVAQLGGEPRVRYAYAKPGADADVLAAFTEQLGDRCWIATREDAVSRGWFGAVEERVLPRLPAVIAATRDPVALVDPIHQRAESVALLGLHGSFTDGESDVPLLVSPGRRTVRR